MLLAGCDKSLPGHADGRRPARSRVGVPVRRLDHARASSATRTSRSSTRSRPSAPAWRGLITRDEVDADRAGDLPGRGRLRRHVHRQHDGQRRRGARHVAARLGRPAGGGPPPRRLRAPVRRGRGGAAAPGDHRPPDPDQGGVRERDRRGDGVRRLHQRRAAPAGDRPRGRGRPDARRLQPGRRRGCRTSATSSRSAAT